MAFRLAAGGACPVGMSFGPDKVPKSDFAV
jgi:hypothetical protein